ncbi:MAG: type II toxin-antitoxin system VapC family toxin [Methanomicrobiales archaeon]|nr:type II toxin-antitoxin system VapC family toxin [Methanomicrobiales archaeon]MDI6877300.1 type II toxin-antitoxin system VapC family toxin [Methanomicrobiales archaeon]
MNGVFVDSNVFLNILEGDERVKEGVLALHSDQKLYRNSIVFSEVVHVFLRLATGERPHALRKTPALIQGQGRNLDRVIDLLDLAESLPINRDIEKEAFLIIADLGLLPNDALIAATCKYYGISRIATFDADFERVGFLEIVNVRS